MSKANINAEVYSYEPCRVASVLFSQEKRYPILSCTAPYPGSFSREASAPSWKTPTHLHWINMKKFLSNFWIELCVKCVVEQCFVFFVSCGWELQKTCAVCCSMKFFSTRPNFSHKLIQTPQTYRTSVGKNVHWATHCTNYYFCIENCLSIQIYDINVCVYNIYSIDKILN